MVEARHVVPGDVVREGDTVHVVEYVTRCQGGGLELLGVTEGGRRFETDTWPEVLVEVGQEVGARAEEWEVRAEQEGGSVGLGLPGLEVDPPLFYE